MGILVKMAKRLTMLMVTLTTAEAKNLAEGKLSWRSSDPTIPMSYPSANCFDGKFQGSNCAAGSEVNPSFTVDLEGVYHVRLIAVTSAHYDQLNPSELLVGNSTDPTENPSCGVIVKQGGFYDCD